MRESQKIEPIALTEKEAAAYLGVSVQFLRQCRHYGHRPGRAQGPPYVPWEAGGLFGIWSPTLTSGSMTIAMTRLWSREVIEDDIGDEIISPKILTASLRPFLN